MLLSLLVFTACSGKSEKQRFTDATIEATCMVFKSGNVNDPGLESKAKAIYKDHGFDVDDQAGMEAIATKYQDDADVQKAVQDALKSCAGDLLNGEVTPDATATTPDATATTPDATATTPDATATTPDATATSTSTSDQAATQAETNNAK